MMIDKQTIVVVPTSPERILRRTQWEWHATEYVQGKYRFTLEDAMQYVSENKDSWMLPYIFLYNKTLRDILRDIGSDAFLYEIRLLRPDDEVLESYISELQKKWRDLEVADFDIDIVAINEDVRIMGHTFHGLDDIKKVVEKSKLDRYSINTYNDIVSFPHVGRVFESYPCFDSYDSMNETRTYQNYIFRREYITDDDIEATHDLPRLDNYRRVHENTPKEMLPMVYYKGDGEYMLVAKEYGSDDEDKDPMDFDELVECFHDDKELRGCLFKYRDVIHWPKQMTCKKCGKPIVSLYYRSPKRTWENLCGREGYLYICPYCKEQDHFDCTIMN